MILHREKSKLMYNWSFLFVVLHKPTLLPRTFKENDERQSDIHKKIEYSLNTVLVIWVVEWYVYILYNL